MARKSHQEEKKHRWLRKEVYNIHCNRPSELQVTSGAGVRAGHSQASCADLTMTITPLSFSFLSSSCRLLFCTCLFFSPLLIYSLMDWFLKASTFLTKTRVLDSQLRPTLKSNIHTLTVDLWLYWKAVLGPECMILRLEASSGVHQGRCKRTWKEKGSNSPKNKISK